MINIKRIRDFLLHIVFGNPLFRPGVHFGHLSYIREHSIVRNHGGGIIIGNHSRIYPYSRIQCIDNKSIIKIGDGVDCHYRFTCLCKTRITIGNHTSIASDVFISDYNHCLDKNRSFNELVGRPVTIGEKCWIGEKAIILAGVSIGNGCVIGAGTVVTKSIPDNSMVVGNPGKIIKQWDKNNSCWQNTF